MVTYFVLSVFSLVIAAFSTGLAFEEYPESINPVNLGIAVFSFGIFLLITAISIAPKKN